MTFDMAWLRSDYCVAQAEDYERLQLSFGMTSQSGRPVHILTDILYLSGDIVASSATAMEAFDPEIPEFELHAGTNNIHDIMIRIDIQLDYRDRI